MRVTVDVYVFGASGATGVFVGPKGYVFEHNHRSTLASILYGILNLVKIVERDTTLKLYTQPYTIQPCLAQPKLVRSKTARQIARKIHKLVVDKGILFEVEEVSYNPAKILVKRKLR